MDARPADLARRQRKRRGDRIARPLGPGSLVQGRRSRPGAPSRSTSQGCPRTTTSRVFSDIAQAFNALTVARCELQTLSAETGNDAFSPSVFSPSVFSPSVFSPSVFSPSVFSPSVFSPVGVQPVGVLAVGLQPVGVLALRVLARRSSARRCSRPRCSAPDPHGLHGRPGPEPDRGLGQRRHGERARLRRHLEQHRLLLHPRQRPQRDLRPGCAVQRSPCTRTPAPARRHHRAAMSRSSPASRAGSNLQTLILTDYSRMTDDGQLTAMEHELDDLRRRLGRRRDRRTSSQVSPRVAALNTQADAQPGCPYAKNLVADAIRDIVTQLPRREPGPEVHRHRRRRPRDPVLPLPRHRRDRPRVGLLSARARHERLAGEPAVQRRALAGRLRRRPTCCT